VSTFQSFPRQSRLLTKHDFGRVFHVGEFRASTRHALVLARTNETKGSRLGLIVAKKHVRTAVQRNRIKRIVREFFRCQPPNIALDIVFLARGDLGTLTNHDIREQLSNLWQKLHNKIRAG